MGLDGKKDAHLDGPSVGAVSQLEVLEGPPGRRVRSEAKRARIATESLLPALRCRRWRTSTGQRAGKFTIGDGAFDSEANCCRAMRRRPFAPLVVKGPLEERHVPTVKLEIAIGDVVV